MLPFLSHAVRVKQNGQLVPRAPASAASPGTAGVAGADANDPTKPGKHKKPLSPEDRERMRNVSGLVGYTDMKRVVLISRLVYLVFLSARHPSVSGAMTSVCPRVRTATTGTCLHKALS
jgi:hypothetical protein